MKKLNIGASANVSRSASEKGPPSVRKGPPSKFEIELRNGFQMVASTCRWVNNKFWITFRQHLKPIISKGWSRRSFCFFFSLERFPKSILVVWPREWYQINPRNIWNKRIEPIFDWRSQNVFWDLQSSLTVSFSHAWMSKWVKNSFRNFKNPFFRSKNQIFFLTQ